MRTPRIAGTWYPDSAEAILKIIAPAAAPEKPSRPAAIIVPHAGYVYSGAVAARAFASLDPGGYDRVIILAPSHCAAM
ncbi:MAG: AmmeMemoRadiSam system protein B, partial [Kiritimatiellae bacterium]|nr:AmmeMemoRadiSam system protein B [Kiritimatiellia bacterium]